MALDLSPYALVTVARLKTHLGRTSVGETDVSDRCIAAINAATSWMEMRTARALKARNWRTQFTVNCDAETNTTAFTAATGGLIEPGDDMFDAVQGYIPAGCQVVSYDTLTDTFVSSLAVTSALTQSAVTFGHVPLVCDGTGEGVLYAPEWPIHTLWAAYEVDSAGNRTQLDTTSARINAMSGRIELPYGIFVEGEQNIELECRAGYEQPTTTVTGDWTDWNALEALALRVAEVFYADGLTLRGRQTDLSMGNLNSRVPDFAMPADIETAVWPFVRTR